MTNPGCFSQSMNIVPQELAAFRRQVSGVRQAQEDGWEASRRLVEPREMPRTLQALREAVGASSWSAPLKDAVVHALGGAHITRAQDLPGEPLKQLTGLPPTKAIRALCLLLKLVPHESSSPWPTTFLPPHEVEALVRRQTNPFDLLLSSPSASVLELGAGDLSFADELSAQYGPSLSRRGFPLILHCLDRLHPQSRLGGPLHPEASRLERLRTNPHLRFRYFGDRDMFELSALDRTHAIAHQYSIVTCWAPATPTFAYEPSRVSGDLIQADLRRTKGQYRTVRVEREAALEVCHQDRFLLFPPWKFDIRGPLALLKLMASRGHLIVLGAVDGQVFWEVLAQLIEDPGARPADRLFTEESRPEIFGEVYQRLSTLPVGRSLDLADVTELRHVFSADAGMPDTEVAFRFRYVQVRRGAVFPGVPASSTARMFTHMSEEQPPWLLILVPERTSFSS